MSIDHHEETRWESFRFGDSPTDIAESSSYADVCADWGQAGSFSVVGASVRGRLHSHEGSSRDDAVSVKFVDPWLAVAVSDGAGSRRLSHHGSSYGASRLSRVLLAKMGEIGRRRRSLLGQDQGGSPNKPGVFSEGSPYQSGAAVDCHPVEIETAIGAAFEQTVRGLARYSARNGVSLADIHCTLLGLALNVRTGVWVVGQVGDGLMVGLRHRGEVLVLVEPSYSEDPSATHFVTEEDWMSNLQCMSSCGLGGIVPRTFFVMTDGVANDCLYGPPPDILERWTSGMDEQLRKVPLSAGNSSRLARYLQSYKAQGSFDDRTLVVVYETDEVSEADA